MTAPTAYPDVSEQQVAVVARYSELFANTGGNNPLGLLQDLQRPHTPEQPNYLATTNIVRFTLAVAVQSQVTLLARLEKDGRIKSGDPVLLVGRAEAPEVLVTLWPTGEATIASRENPGQSWGPPSQMEDRS